METRERKIFIKTNTPFDVEITERTETWSMEDILQLLPPGCEAKTYDYDGDQMPEARLCFRRVRHFDAEGNEVKLTPQYRLAEVTYKISHEIEPLIERV